VTDALGAAAGSPWALLLVLAVTAVDGVLPPVPSESVVIAVAALTGPGDGPRLAALWLLAACGAFAGDQVAYALGRHVVGPRRGRLRRFPRTTAAVARAERAVVDRDVVVLLVARFVPGGRVAVNMAAGTAGLGRRRFAVLTGLAAVLWSTYSVGLGLGAAQVVGADPVAAAVGGVLLGAVVGVVVDRGVKARRRLGVPSAAGAAAPDPAASARPPAPRRPAAA
jgi:membrane protein DedA with SNARE-associated domain